MISFEALSIIARAFFALWALLLCLTNITNAVFSAVKKRYFLSSLSLLLFTSVYLLWQVIFDISLFGTSEKAADISQAMGKFSLAYWIAILAVLTLISVLMLGYNIWYDKTFITPGAIKLYLDKIPCGICCWRDNGRVLFSNICMNRLCSALTDSPLLNGNQFRDALTERILPVEGKIWRFSCRDIVFAGEIIHEMIATDITTEYARTQALEKDKAELSRFNRELSEYTLSIDDTVRMQEILQAKVNIHDEMNRLMLSTVAAKSEDTAELDRIFSLWEQNALLLCMEADKNSDTKASEHIETLAEAIKIRLIWQEALPDALSEKQRSLFFSAAQEAIANAVKHAEAKTVSISFNETENLVFCNISNDGILPSDPVHFTGGLANLSLIAENQGASVSVSLGETFTLSLQFPKNS